MNERFEKRRQELEVEKQRVEDDIRREEKLITEKNAIYGRDYDRYSLQEVNRITNYDFLDEIYNYTSVNRNQCDLNDHQERCNTIAKREGDFFFHTSISSLTGNFIKCLG